VCTQSPQPAGSHGLPVSAFSASVNLDDLARMRAGVAHGLQHAEDFHRAMTQPTPAASTWGAMTRASLGGMGGADPERERGWWVSTGGAWNAPAFNQPT
jgi:hypothetical protein